ncbi:MAG: endonuclease III [Bacteroidales bacterium]|nr:endonuclease III [Bacteroidales bacterium]MDD3201212.1 endonuclease III [Bacteroidales bacterium]
MIKKYADIIGWFQENVPVAESELHFNSPFQLVVSVILSAQCTDKRVNMVTPALFERFKTPEDMATSSVEEIFQYIKSISFPNSKAKHLLEMSQMLVNEFGSVVPSEVEQLEKMPGVGRKTANVVASIVYNKPVIAVDTHVFRVANRTGLSHGSNVLRVEEELTRNIPTELRPIAHHWLILHGRYTCVARKPKCSSCGIAPYCDYFKKLS